MEDIQLFPISVVRALPLLKAFFLFIENIAPTPKMDAVRSRNCAMRYKTESCISPGGGVMNPAMPNPTAAMNDKIAIEICILEIVLMLCSIYDFFMSFDIIIMIVTFAL